jgi:nucleolar protein 6
MCPGNLRFATTKETIAQHFSKCSAFIRCCVSNTSKPRLLAPAPTIRLLTNKDTGKSKGCAFVEFKTSGSLQEGLGLHHTIVDGRKINVELTAGGGGKSVMRQTRIKNRNAELEKQRVS